MTEHDGAHWREEDDVKVIDFMLNRIYTSVGQINDYNHGDKLVFTAENGDVITFCHIQDCCENVFIEDVVGNLSALVGAPLLMAEEVSNWSDSGGGSVTWTFYKFATRNGFVTVRWYGESNGYYSEEVNCFVNGERRF